MKVMAVLAGLDKELIELVLLQSDVECVGILDAKDVGDILGVPWLGTDGVWPAIKQKQPGLKVIIGLDMPSSRKHLATLFGIDSVIGVRSAHAVISHSAQLCDSAIVQCGAKILADARIGFSCKINHDAVIHHDCIVGDYCTLSPGSRLLGNVTLEQEVFIGSGAVVLPHISVSRGARVGAGAVVTRDVPAGKTVVGCPAVEMIKPEEAST